MTEVDQTIERAKRSGGMKWPKATAFRVLVRRGIWVEVARFDRRALADQHIKENYAHLPRRTGVMIDTLY